MVDVRGFGLTTMRLGGWYLGRGAMSERMDWKCRTLLQKITVSCGEEIVTVTWNLTSSTFVWRIRVWRQYQRGEHSYEIHSVFARERKIYHALCSVPNTISSFKKGSTGYIIWYPLPSSL